MAFENRRHSEPVDLARHLEFAHQLFHNTVEPHALPTEAPNTNTDFETLRWFPYATDVAR